MKIDDTQHERLVGRNYANHRYYCIEPDGSAHPGYSYQQRPAAVKFATGQGLGLYDAREREIIVEPDVERRLQIHNDLIANHYTVIAGHRRIIAKIEEAT